MPRHFSNWLQGYLDYTNASESPTAFHFWTGVATIAGALRRRVWIDMRYFQWAPNFYIILVGPPGVAAKSTTIQSGMKLLERLKLPFGPSSMTWQALAKSLEESIQTVKYFDKEGNQAESVFSAITVPVSELGTFLRMDDNSLIDVLIDLWDGGLRTWSHKTKSSGNTEIKNPWINLIACTTPSWLQNNFPEHMIGGGLTSRVIFVYGDKKRHLVAYPFDFITGDKHRETEDKLFHDLCEISTLAGEYVLTEGALSFGRHWYEEHWTKRPPHLSGERYGGYISRKQTHIHKLAMVISAAKRSRLVIEEADLREANELITSIEADMQKVFTSIGLVDSARQIQEIVSYVRAHGFISTQDLWNLCISSMNMQVFRQNVEAAIHTGQVKAEQRLIDGKMKAGLVMSKPAT